MAKQTPGMVKTFGADTAISSANVCVVMSGSNAGNVSLPGGANATKFAGVTFEASAGISALSVPVVVSGIAQVQSDGSGTIAAGDYLVIGNTSGQVKTVNPATGTNVREIVGMALSGAAATAGLLVDMLIQPNVYIGA